MPYNANANGSDMDKLYTALHDVLASFGSVESMLQAFGLAQMPSAQRYGILFGVIVFGGTVGSVVLLLFLGGSFQRMQEQSVTGESTLLSAGQTRRQRALLYEQLLAARQRMVADYEKSSSSSSPLLAENAAAFFSPLLQLLLNQAPSKVQRPPDLLDERDANSKMPQQPLPTNKSPSNPEQFVPHMYKENYVKAYRRCQDRPGGKNRALLMFFFVLSRLL
jgi:hypothetical protein